MFLILPSSLAQEPTRRTTRGCTKPSTSARTRGKPPSPSTQTMPEKSVDASVGRPRRQLSQLGRVPIVPRCSHTRRSGNGRRRRRSRRCSRSMQSTRRWQRFGRVTTVMKSLLSSDFGLWSNGGSGLEETEGAETGRSRASGSPIGRGLQNFSGPRYRAKTTLLLRAIVSLKSISGDIRDWELLPSHRRAGPSTSRRTPCVKA